MPRRHFFLGRDDTAKAALISFMQASARRQSFRVRRRGNAVLLSNQGWTIQQISRALKVSIPTVRKWLHRFQAKGVLGLYDPPRDRSLTPEQEAQLFEVSQRARIIGARRPIKGLPSYRRLSAWVKDQWGISLSAKQVSRIIRRKLLE